MTDPSSADDKPFFEQLERSGNCDPRHAFDGCDRPPSVASLRHICLNAIMAIMKLYAAMVPRRRMFMAPGGARRRSMSRQLHFLGLELLLAAALGLAAVGGTAMAGDVVVSISVGQPGFFGQINIGNIPQAQVVYAQPVVVQPAPG